MSRRTWVIAVALLMIASAVFVVAPPTSGTAAPHRAVAPVSTAVRPAATTLIEPYSGYGYPDRQFVPGTGPGGELYFAVYDPSGDRFVNVTLVDHNATRDGVGSPAYRVEVPIDNATGWYYSWLSGTHYTFPSVSIGGVWNLTASAPLGGSYNTSVTLSLFYENLSANTGGTVLPGQPITLFYATFYNSNGANYGSLTNLTLYGQYFGANDTLRPVADRFTQILTASPGSGQWSFVVPANATPNTSLNFTLTGTVYSNGYVAETGTASTSFTIGVPAIDYVYLSETPNTCNGYSSNLLNPGLPVFGCVYAGAEQYGGGGFTPAAGLSIAIRYWNGTTWVAPSGATIRATTNASGYATFSFPATSPPFGPAYYFGGSRENAVNVTATDPTATNVGGAWNWTAGYNRTFQLGTPQATGDVAVALNQSVYLPGAAATVQWTLGASAPSSVGNLTVEGWYAYTLPNFVLVGTAALSGSAQSGTFALSLPAGYIGEVAVYVCATNATTGFCGYASAYATAPTLTLATSSGYYAPGATVSVTPTAMFVPAGTTIGYEVYATYYNGQGQEQQVGLVSTGSVANGSAIEIAVPAQDAPGEYEVAAWAATAGGNVLVSTQTYLYEESGYQLLLGIQTVSKYSDGSFQPGESVTFSYSIQSYGTATLPSVYAYQVFVYDTAIELYLQGTATSGTFQVTIPSNQPAGVIEVEVEVAGHGLTGPNCGSNYCYAWTLLTVNPSPSVLGLDVAPGSGLTVGWLILLVLIVVVAIALGVLLRRHRRNPPSAGSGGSASVMAPPAPAPSSPAPPEWKEPAPSEAPPMPTPPPGAQ